MDTSHNLLANYGFPSAVCTLVTTCACILCTSVTTCVQMTAAQVWRCEVMDFWQVVCVQHVLQALAAQVLRGNLWG